MQQKYDRFKAEIDGIMRRPVQNHTTEEQARVKRNSLIAKLFIKDPFDPEMVNKLISQL